MDTFMPEGALKALRGVNARYYHLEPGDGTRYEFIVGYIGLSDQDEYFCVGIGGARFPYTVFDGQDVRDYIERHPSWDGGPGERSCIHKVGNEEHMDPWIADCQLDTQANPWTIVTAVMAVNSFMINHT